MSTRSSHARATARFALLLVAVLGFTLLGAANALAITRDAVLARAQTWIDHPVPYSQSKYFGGYRTDCSGYVSMCWQTGTSWSTRTFYQVSHRTTAAFLKPGDAMLKAGTHIRLFYGWANAAHTQYVAYEQTGPNTKSSVRSLADDLAYGYLPYRYNAIEDSPPSRNALLNGSFNVWSRGDPVWWSVGGPGAQPDVVQRADVYKAGKFSLELDNRVADPRRFAEMEQTAAVSPNTTYTLSVWARTAGDPHSLEMHLSYLSASGSSLVDTWTTGEVWAVGGSRFARMSLLSSAPTGAVTALVAVRLAGGTDASGTVGNSAVLDEISLARPQTTITIQADATTTRVGRTQVLSGSVTPTSAIGTNMVVYVEKPGTSRWSYSSNRTIYTSGSGAAWQYKYYFKPGMAKGVYNYKAVVGDLPGYLGSTSPTIVSIRLQ